MAHLSHHRIQPSQHHIHAPLASDGHHVTDLGKPLEKKAEHVQIQHGGSNFLW